MIEEIGELSVRLAAAVHSAAWKESHRAFCPEAFIDAHTPERQEAYLRKIMREGAAIYLLTAGGEPVGVVSVKGALIGDLYVLPDRQRQGYGTALLRFAMERCEGTPRLWVLSNNSARAFYEKHGFAATGDVRPLSGGLSEIEMRAGGYPGDRQE